MSAPIEDREEEKLSSPATDGEDRSANPSQWRLLLNTVVRHPLRFFVRGVWLSFEVGLVMADYIVQIKLRRGDASARDRARWLQRGSRRTLRALNVEMQTSGRIPAGGLLVSNHLSYLDILVLSAITSCAFVSKSEVRKWPVFGWFALLAGTVFVNRESRQDVARSAEELRDALREDRLVVLFPEGTSSDGRTVLPFKSALLAPAEAPDLSLSVAFIHYHLADGSVADEVCYWRDMTLAPHLLNLLGKRAVSVHISFAPFEQDRSNRKMLARQLHSEVLRLKDALPSENE
jgi:lyso-ornithine lipid O-acyltransferase